MPKSHADIPSGNLPPHIRLAKALLRFYKRIFLTQRLFWLTVALITGFVAAYFFDSLFPLMKVLTLLLAVSLIADIWLLCGSRRLEARRELPSRFSNGDLNEVNISLHHTYPFDLRIRIVDELPPQFQMRDFIIPKKLPPGRTLRHTYRLRPVERGEYRFGDLLVYARSPLGLISCRHRFPAQTTVKVYPSYLALKQYNWEAFRQYESGLRKIRRLGHTLEFEHIKAYVPGDDIRTINWKATAKRGKLMVNHYTDKKSQPVYAVIDKGRVMKMPFLGMSLLDYAINSALVIAHAAIHKHDRAGVMTFGRKPENHVVAARRNHQMQYILDALYAVETDFSESDFGALYAYLKRNVPVRSLIFLYTNFETADAMERQLPYLRLIARDHLLVTVFFRNTELEAFAAAPSRSTEDLYARTLAEQFVWEKRYIVKKLNLHGIYTVLAEPSGVGPAVVRKYFELKARGLI